MANLIGELKRRNVFRVGIAYLVAGWVIMQVIDVVVEPLHLPEWTATLVILLLLVGLPITLFLAWAFEMTPDGVKKTEDVKADASVTAATGQKLNLWIIGAMAIAIALLLVDRFMPTETSRNAPSIETASIAATKDASIAVLPFADLSQAKDQEYFSDGISEELLNVLAQIPELRVASRTSSFQFKGTNPDMGDVGQKLNVAHVLEGSVRKAGTRLRITAQLIDAGSGYHLWSGTYDRELEDIFAIQDEISAAIVEALVAELGIAPVAAPKAVTAEVTADAYEDYLRAKQALNAPTRESMATARRLIDRALEAAPNFAQAHSLAALIYFNLARENYGDMSLDESTALAQPHVELALTLDPNLAEAYGNKARLASRLGRQADALALYEKSLALKPSQSGVQRAYSVLLFDRFNRFEEAIKANELAMSYDPLDHRSRQDLAVSLAWASRFDEAEIHARRMQAEYPPGFYEAMFQIYVNSGDTLEALKILSLGYKIMVNSGASTESLPSELAAIGLRREARALIRAGVISPLFPLGDYEAAAEILEERLGENPDLEDQAILLGATYALLGRYGEAAALLEPAWTRNNASITVQLPLRANIGAALYFTRRALGNAEGAAEVRAALAEFVRLGDESNLALHESGPLSLALVDLSGGDRADAAARLKDLIARGAYGFNLDVAHTADIRDGPYFKEVAAAQAAKKKEVRRQYLEWACNIDPPAGAWLPDAERCAEVK